MSHKFLQRYGFFVSCFTIFQICNFVISSSLSNCCVARAFLLTWWRLALQVGVSTNARTGAKVENFAELSSEPRPRLRQTASILLANPPIGSMYKICLFFFICHHVYVSNKATFSRCCPRCPPCLPPVVRSPIQSFSSRFNNSYISVQSFS